MSSVASSRHFLKTFINSSEISGPAHHRASYLTSKYDTIWKYNSSSDFSFINEVSRAGAEIPKSCSLNPEMSQPIINMHLKTNWWNWKRFPWLHFGIEVTFAGKEMTPGPDKSRMNAEQQRLLSAADDTAGDAGESWEFNSAKNQCRCYWWLKKFIFSEINAISLFI